MSAYFFENLLRIVIIMPKCSAGFEINKVCRGKVWFGVQEGNAKKFSGSAPTISL